MTTVYPSFSTRVGLLWVRCCVLMLWAISFFVFGVFFCLREIKTKGLLCNERMQNVHTRYVKERKDFCLGTN